jgi:predicted TIM-barrel fold metal-dependent hydrolase
MAEHLTNLSAGEIHRYLSLARSLKGQHHFYDMHVHPFEIVFNKGTYEESQDHSGIFSTGTSAFKPPQISELTLEHQGDKASASGMVQRPAIFKMKFSALYAHTGPEVFRAQMDLSTVDRILLLPVAPLVGNIDSQMSDMKRIFQEDENFFFAWSVSNDLENSDVYSAAQKAIENYNICSVKQNLTHTGINISQPDGNRRLQIIMEVCSGLSLPLILHSGRSPLASEPEQSKYGEIDVLETFNWNNYSCPVVFAHSAAYGYTATEIKTNIVPRLKKLISKNDNILVDISGVDAYGLKDVLEGLPSERILFGSDALYEPQWQRVVKLLHTLENSSLDTEHSFFNIMSHNPRKYIFNQCKKERDHAQR